MATDDMNQGLRDSSIVVVDGQSDRRRFPRRMAESTFVAGSISGRLVNMSESGLGLETQNPLPVMKKGIFTLDIGTTRPQFQGQIRWCRLTGTEPKTDGEAVPVYRAGVSLVSR